MRTCPTCSGELQQDSSICSVCGTPVGPSAEPQTGLYQPVDSRLVTGQVLAGHYRVGELLGKGGMGEVYRARDEKLGRDVALKVVRRDLAADPSRLERLQREARLLASLNHPHLAQLYSLEQDDNLHFLIMELVPGPTLAQRLEMGPLPLADALQLARQLAEALEAAHEQGVIHRDLKPANVKVTPEGRVKVLDFGLAKLIPAAGPTPRADPAITQEGFVLGTPAYMSPEQARGHALDKRSDVWSFGCVLFELLAGGRAFPGGTGSDVIAAVLQREPDWQALPVDVPPRVRELAKRCLRKDTRQRLRDLGDARIVLEETLAAPPSAAEGARQPSGLTRWWLAAVLGGISAVLLAGIALLAGMWVGARRAPPPPADAARPLPEWSGDLLVGGSTVVMEPHVSPDGRRLAFITLVDGQSQVAVMDLGPSSARTFRVLTTKKDSGLAYCPTWSRDGTRLYFCRLYTAPFSGVFTVHVGEDRREEQLVLSDASSPEVLPDGDLLLDRLEPPGHQLYHLVLDRGTLERVGGPFAVPGAPNVSLSVFPDGKEVVFVGRPADDPGGNFGYFVTDLSSGRTRRVGPVAGTDPGLYPAVRAADDGSFYAVQRSGDIYRVVQIPRHGEPSPRACLTLPWIPAEIDVDRDGSFYVRHASRPDEVLRFPVQGGVPARLMTWHHPLTASPIATPSVRLLPLPGGQVLIPASGWGTRVQLAEPGKGPRDFVQTSRETSMPAATLGADRVALLLGTGPGRKLAVVSVRDGRILQSIEDSPTGYISALAGAPDGQALYFVESGMVWRISLADRKAKREQVCPGLRLAPDPNGRDLIVLRLEQAGYRLFRVALQGGQEIPIPFLSDDLRLNRQALTDGCVAADGRIVVGVASVHSWYFGPAILDPTTGKVEKIPLEYEGDVGLARWGTDGQMFANGLPVKTELWRFRRVEER
jgi:hypothetical protein